MIGAKTFSDNALPVLQSWGRLPMIGLGLSKHLPREDYLR